MDRFIRTSNKNAIELLKKYYLTQSQKGLSSWQSTLLLPFKLLNRLLPRLPKSREGNVMYGYKLYHRPLLASYSRSGTNWIRYIIESITECPTPGQKRIVVGNNYFIDRAHCAYPVLKKHRKVILIIRDYKECLLRQNKEDWLKDPNPEKFLTNSFFPVPAEWFIKNIQAFHEYNGKKILIYYEDLMTNPKDEIKKISEFLKLDRHKTDDFLQNLDLHFANSVSAYTSGGHKSETSATKDLEFHRKQLLTEEQAHKFDDFYLRNYPNLVNIYLGRYHYKLCEEKLDE